MSLKDDVTGILDKKTNTFYVLESGPVGKTYNSVDRIRSILVAKGILKYAETPVNEQPQVVDYGTVKDRKDLKVQTLYITDNVRKQAEKEAAAKTSNPWTE